MTVVAVELEDRLAIDLKEVAESLATSERDLVQRAVASYLRQLKMDRIRAEVRPFAEEAGFFSEQDVYGKIS